MDSPQRRDDFAAAWQRWCAACENEWKSDREAWEGRPAKSVAKMIEKEMASLGLNERLMEDQMVAAWAEVVGPANAFHTRPVQLKRGELIVAVSQPALKYDLERFHQAEILRRMQERFGEKTIQAIRFRVGN